MFDKQLVPFLNEAPNFLIEKMTDFSLKIINTYSFCFVLYTFLDLKIYFVFC